MLSLDNRALARMGENLLSMASLSCYAKVTITTESHFLLFEMRETRRLLIASPFSLIGGAKDVGHSLIVAPHHCHLTLAMAAVMCLLFKALLLLIPYAVPLRCEKGAG